MYPPRLPCPYTPDLLAPFRSLLLFLGELFQKQAGHFGVVKSVIRVFFFSDNSCSQSLVPCFFLF